MEYRYVLYTAELSVLPYVNYLLHSKHIHTVQLFMDANTHKTQSVYLVDHSGRMHSVCSISYYERELNNKSVYLYSIYGSTVH